MSLEFCAGEIRKIVVELYNPIEAMDFISLSWTLTPKFPIDSISNTCTGNSGLYTLTLSLKFTSHPVHAMGS
jgi:hypothetical protein